MIYDADSTRPSLGTPKSFLREVHFCRPKFFSARRYPGTYPLWNPQVYEPSGDFRYGDASGQWIFILMEIIVARRNGSDIGSSTLKISSSNPF